MTDEKLPRTSILRKRADFSKARNQGRRIAGSFLLLNWFVEEESQRQVGIIASKTLGGAVVRNKLRRRVREAYRRIQKKLRQGLKSVWVLRKNATRASYNDLKDEMEKIYSREKLLEGKQ